MIIWYLVFGMKVKFMRAVLLHSSNMKNQLSLTVPRPVNSYVISCQNHYVLP